MRRGLVLPCCPHGLAADTMHALANAAPHPELVAVPPPNPYVPDDFSMLPACAASAEEADVGGRVWHLDAGRFARPLVP